MGRQADNDLLDFEAADRAGRLGTIWDVFKTWGPALLAVFAIRSAVAEPFRIPSGSMVPTLEIGDHILVSKFKYGLRVPFTDVEILPLEEPERGDVIVFRYPPNPDLDYIKRIVAGPGQSLEIRDKVVYVDGDEFVPYPGQQFMQRAIQPSGYSDPHIWPRGKGWNKDNYGPVKVPEDQFFMMGDNRDNSADSRYWGFLPRENIVGKAWMIYFSFDKRKMSEEFWQVIRWQRLLNLIN